MTDKQRAVALRAGILLFTVLLTGSGLAMLAAAMFAGLIRGVFSCPC